MSKSYPEMETPLFRYLRLKFELISYSILFIWLCIFVFFVLTIFPPHQHNQVRYQLAQVLKAIISQRLVPTADGKSRVPAGVRAGVQQ